VPRKREPKAASWECPLPHGLTHHKKDGKVHEAKKGS